MRVYKHVRETLSPIKGLFAASSNCSALLASTSGSFTLYVKLVRADEAQAGSMIAPSQTRAA